MGVWGAAVMAAEEKVAATTVVEERTVEEERTMVAERAAHPCTSARSIKVQRLAQVFLYGKVKTPAK